MAHITADVCIIGAGSGGLSLAAGAAQMGARVVLIEGGEMGGDCLNAGCVPSKALLAAAKAAHAVQAGAGFGISAAAPQIDFAAAKAHVSAAIAAIAPMDSQERFEGLGVQVLRAFGRFIAKDQVQAGDDIITARRFVIATGSRPFIPPIPGLSQVPYLTNETIFAQTIRPDHLIILGGGPIGLEMAQAHRRLGARVSVIEGAKALGRDDPEAAAVVLAALMREGVEIYENQPAQEITSEGTGICVHMAGGAKITGSHLLVATGRKVALEGLGLDAAGIAHTPRGISVTPALRSISNRRVYAVGDAAGGLQFTHVAGAHAGVVIRQILLGLPARAAQTVPWVTYTDPELAQIGPTESEARAKYGAKLSVHRVDFTHNDRAVATGHTIGFLKLMVVNARPVGVTIVGSGAGEMIGLWALAISARLKLSAISAAILPYPTLSEISKRAAGAYFAPKLFESGMIKSVVRFVQRFTA